MLTLFDPETRRSGGADLAKRATAGVSKAEKWLRDALGTEETHAGVNVTEETAMKYTAVFACVRVLAESVAGLPLPLYRRLGDDDREKAVEHPLYHLLRAQPNPYQTGYHFRLLMLTWVLLHGNAYAEIERAEDGTPINLWPIRPDWVFLDTRDGSPSYTVFAGGKRAVIPFLNMLHFQGLSTDGWLGLSPIGCARQSIGLSLVAERFGAEYFGKGSRVGGFLKLKEDVGDKTVEELRDAWERAQSGPDSFHRIAVITGGMEFEPLTISNQDGQFIETRRLGIEDICRVYRVPGHMVADLSKANYSNVSALDASFVKYSLTPWTNSVEATLNAKLLGPRQRDTLYFEHDFGGLLRGDLESRLSSYQRGIYSGVYSPNYCRKLENLPAREGGDVYLQPTNVAPSPYNPQQNGGQQ